MNFAAGLEQVFDLRKYGRSVAAMYSWEEIL